MEQCEKKSYTHTTEIWIFKLIFHFISNMCLSAFIDGYKNIVSIYFFFVILDISNRKLSQLVKQSTFHRLKMRFFFGKFDGVWCR